MLRIRMHGRGGQGIKTAGQILGSAAFLAGFQAQDFPLYGAERRGAPVTSFTRVSPEPVLERGPIGIPDLLLIADATLLESVRPVPLNGADESTTIFINSSLAPETLQQYYQLPSLPVGLNLIPLCRHYLKKANLYSSALASVGARLMGSIDMGFLLEAVEIELEQQGLAEKQIEHNKELAQKVFESLTSVNLQERERTVIKAGSLALLEPRLAADSAPIILAAGNMALRKTGNWRVDRPEIDYKRCNQCLICYARCPEGAISVQESGSPEIDYEHCKGCMICAEECPGNVIQTVSETEDGS